MDMHKHLYSFCGEPGCRDREYHANTEDLVSTPLTDKDIAEYFAAEEKYGSSDEYVIVICVEPCINPGPSWVYVRRDDPILKALRPQHAEEGGVTYLSDHWAKR